MIKPEKLPNALHALQSVIVKARSLAYNGAPAPQIADILDAAEMLPRLIGSETDETDKFRRYLVEIGERHKCGFVVQYFDDPSPPKW